MSSPDHSSHGRVLLSCRSNKLQGTSFKARVEMRLKVALVDYDLLDYDSLCGGRLLRVVGSARGCI